MLAQCAPASLWRLRGADAIKAFSCFALRGLNKLTRSLSFVTYFEPRPR